MDSRAAVVAEPARVGFVVSKSVGGSVVRHRVQRKLRHVVRDRLSALPVGTLLVVRALPPAATATSAELAADVDAAFRRLGLTVGPSTVDAGSDAIGAPSGRAAAVDNSPSPVDGSL